jgi:hypothetical protein
MQPLPPLHNLDTTSMSFTERIRDGVVVVGDFLATQGTNHIINHVLGRKYTSEDGV